MVVEKPDGKVAKGRDWFGALYFGAFALICLYDMLSGAKAVSAFLAAPLIFTLLVSALFILFLYFARLLSALRKSVGSRISPNEADRLGSTFVLIGMLLALAYAIYAQLDGAGKAELLSVSSVAFIIISVFQVVAATYPHAMKGKMGEKLQEWLKSAVSFGATPGIAAFMGATFLFLSAELLVSTEFRMAVLRGIGLFILLIFLLAKSHGIRLPVDSSVSGAKKAGLVLISLVLAVALTLALPGLLAGAVAASEYFLALLVAYALLAGFEYEGKRMEF